MQWTGIVIYRIANGKVVDERGEEDYLTVLRQLGPAAATLIQAR